MPKVLSFILSFLVGIVAFMGWGVVMMGASGPNPAWVIYGVIFAGPFIYALDGFILGWLLHKKLHVVSSAFGWCVPILFTLAFLIRCGFAGRGFTTYPMNPSYVLLIVLSCAAGTGGTILGSRAREKRP